MRSWIVLALLLLSAAPAAAAAPEGPACGAPEEFLASGPLPNTARALRRNALHVLVIGSASVTGPGGSGPSRAYPVQLERQLRRANPGASITMEVRGGRGLTAADHLALIDGAIADRRPNLVIWQGGTVEAVRGTDVGEMLNLLRAGAERAATARADLILMDMQWSRFLRANADVESYRDAMRSAVAATGAALFSRYDLMRAWAEAETVDVERAPRERRTVEVDKLNDCLGQALAAFIARGVAEAR
ncbi:SGNH/GDSL hydrolase family protein [Roseomonas sp. CCTCC AB2023176]|uniref:SGNH/GDSL hydrolase family protein n=1 Tax=Roseomonas sp. CCTCC AB2023176 TaxID=3342640 RepID=UPI0035D531F8